MFVLRNRPRPFTIVLCVVYMGGLLLLMVANHLGPERWWWSGLNMYVPQWVWGLPAIVLLLATSAAVPRLVYVPIGALLIVAGPMMGFRWAAPDKHEGVPIRVMTYNIQLSGSDVSSIASEIASADADILCLQDAGGAVHRLESLLRDWNTVAHREYLIASRFPIKHYSISNVADGEHEDTYLQGTLAVENTDVTVVTAHLLTSRNALYEFRSIDRWSEGVALIRDDFENRLTQARLLARALHGITGPLIVAGDFNVPSTSLVVRTLADIGLHDAFAAGGRGYGYTFGHSSKLGHSFVRIDHILLSAHLRPTLVKTGSARASDHRPVIADLVLTR